ncbi:MAG: hypothetical protein ABJC26_05390 [Gemmatimonadaceae bacterium]
MLNTISRVAGATLALLVLVASYNVSAVQAQKSTNAALVTTACNYGQVTECGHEPVRTVCSREVKSDMGWLTRTFGFGLGPETCVQIGDKTLYKDFFRGGAAGSCMVWSGVGKDGTSIKPKLNDEPSDGSEDDSSCS